MDRARSVSPELHANFSWSAAVREELAASKRKGKGRDKKKERMETKETLHVEGDQLEDLGQDLGEVQELATGALQSRVGKP